MNTAARYLGQLGHRRHLPDGVEHDTRSARRRVTQRQAQHRADVILELATDRAIDSPVTRVVNARRDLVCQQAPVGHKELKGHDTNVIQRLHDPC